MLRFFCAIVLFPTVLFSAVLQSTAVGPSNVCTIASDSVALFQNGYIVGPYPSATCAAGATYSKWVRTTNIDTFHVMTVQHRLYDKSSIYNPSGQLIWSWAGESVPATTWYEERFSVFVKGNDSLRMEFVSGYPNFCVGRLQVISMVCSQPYNNPPGFISTPDTLATEDLLWSYAITAVDVDAGDIVSYSLRTPPTGMSLSGNIVTWTPTNANVGLNIVTIRATDSRGAFSDQAFRVHVANVNQAPTITSAAPTAAVQNQLFQYQAQAVDPDVGDILTWQLTSAPQGMSISSSGLVTWTPTQAQVGSNNVVLQVRDAAGLTAQQSFSITVTNVNDAPVITDPPAQNAVEDAPFSLQLVGIDPDGNQVFWFVVQAPESLKVVLNTGLLTWTPRHSVAGTTVTVKIRATDAVLSDTTTFTIAVTAVNHAPVITTVLPTTFKLDTLYSIPLTATDLEGDAITWSVPHKPATMNIIGNNLVWAPTVLGLDTITIVATDGKNPDTLSQVVQVLITLGVLQRMHASAVPVSFALSAVHQRAGTVSVIAGLPANAGMGTITLFSISGKKLAEQNISGGGWHTLTYNNVSTGAYLLRLNAGGKSIVQRVSSF